MCRGCYQDGEPETTIEEVKNAFFEKKLAKRLQIQKKAVPLHRN
jgi:hypothetical protein